MFQQTSTEQLIQVISSLCDLITRGNRNGQNTSDLHALFQAACDELISRERQS